MITARSVGRAGADARQLYAVLSGASAEGRKQVVRRKRGDARQRIPKRGIQLAVEACTGASVEERDPGKAVIRAHEKARRAGQRSPVPPVRIALGWANQPSTSVITRATRTHRGAVARHLRDELG